MTAVECRSDVKLCPKGPVIGDVMFHCSIEIFLTPIPGVLEERFAVKVENSGITCVGVLHAARMEGHLVIMHIALKVAAHRC